MKSFILILASVVLLSCKQNNPAAEFSTYLASIDTPTLPFNIGDLKPSVNFDTALFRKFKHQDAQKPCGKVTVGDSVVLIIEQMNFSEENMIRTVHASGREIETKSLYAGSEDCSSDYGFSCSRTIVVNSDRSIIVTDSIRRSTINQKGEIVNDSEQLRVTQRNWNIDNSGHFIMGSKIRVDSTIISKMTTDLYDTANFNKDLHPEEAEGSDAIMPKIYFVDLDSETPNVIVSFHYAQGGNDLEAEDAAIVYFKQKHGQWTIDNVEVVPLQSLDNGDAP